MAGTGLNLENQSVDKAKKHVLNDCTCMFCQYDLEQ